MIVLELTGVNLTGSILEERKETIFLYPFKHTKEHKTVTLKRGDIDRRDVDFLYTFKLWMGKYVLTISLG